MSMGASVPDQALAVPAGPVPRPGPPGFDPSRTVRRTLKPFASAPRDGEPFHILNTVRFNPAAKRFEILVYGEDDQPKWELTNFHSEPSYWVREVPLAYEIPSRNWFAFTLTYRAVLVRKTRRERFFDWLLGKFPMLKFLVGLELSRRFASAIEARSDATPESDAAEGESAAREAGDAQ